MIVTNEHIRMQWRQQDIWSPHVMGEYNDIQFWYIFGVTTAELSPY